MLAGATYGDAVQRIAFGSCWRQGRGEEFWQPLLAYDPEIMIFLGDNGYPDAYDPPRFDQTYAQLMGHPAFRALESSADILATWDDHDFGDNDIGKNNPYAEEAKASFVKYWRLPDASPVRAREGIYDVRYFRLVGGKRLQVILLDTRSFRSDLDRKQLESGRRVYVPSEDPEKTMLGTAQWAWLEAVLQSPAEVRIIASSIQVVSEEHDWEKWSNLPRERARLLEMVDSADGLSVYISGDRHRAEISVLPAGDYSGFSLSTPAVDVTSSSLNSGNMDKVIFEEPNRWRYGDTGGMQSIENFATLTLEGDGDSLLLAGEIRSYLGEILERIEFPIE